MNVLAGFVIMLSVFGFVLSLRGNENSVWLCAGLKIALFMLSLFSGIFAIVYLIAY